MAATPKDNAAGNTAVPHEGDHDRVQMLSLRADGTPDQHNPELIGDKEATAAFTREQFAQQAVSAVDVERRGVTTVTGDEVKQDPSIADLKKAHDSAASAAEKAADKTVDSLHKGE